MNSARRPSTYVSDPSEIPTLHKSEVALARIGRERDAALGRYLKTRDSAELDATMRRLDAEQDRQHPRHEDPCPAGALLCIVDAGLEWSVAASGWTSAWRTATWEAMIGSATRGALNVLVVGYVSRFLRNLKQTLIAVEDHLHTAGVVVPFADERLLSSDPSALFTKLEVEGYRKMTYELTPDAANLGLGAALPAQLETDGHTGGFGRGERARTDMSEVQVVRFVSRGSELSEMSA